MQLFIKITAKFLPCQVPRASITVLIKCGSGITVVCLRSGTIRKSVRAVDKKEIVPAVV